MIYRKLPAIAACLAVLSALIACAGLSSDSPLSVGGPTPEYSPVPVSTEAVDSLGTKLGSLGATSGQVTVSITEPELTSVVEQQMAAQPNGAFSNPQVYLRDGKIRLYTTVTTNNLKANALIVFKTAVQNNQVQVAVESADFGPIPVPQAVLDTFTTSINNQLASLVAGLPAGVAIQDIAIADGTLTLTALVK